MTYKTPCFNHLSYIGFNWRRTAFCHFLLFILGVFILSAPSYAEEEQYQFDDPYTVEEIEVDVTADNAVAAREKALEEAQLKGYEKLAHRFLSEEEKASFEMPDINEVSRFVKDFEVTNEKLSAYRYKGTYTIRFSERAFGKPDMDGLYQNADVMQQSEILVVPFYEVNGRYFLWQVNPFLQAWARAKSNNVLGKAIVPIGDVNDIAQLKDNQGLSYDPSSLNAMRIRYRAKDVALMIATPEQMANGATNVAISLYNARPYGPELAQQFSVKGYAGEVEEQLYNRVVATISQLIHRGWKRQTAVQSANNDFDSNNNVPPVQQAPLTGPKSSLMAQINFGSARQWVNAKKSIERARGVQSVLVKSLSPQSATLMINYVGEIQNLRTALQQQGVGLNDPQTQYTQTNAGGAPIYQLYAAPRVGQPSGQYF